MARCAGTGRAVALNLRVACKVLASVALIAVMRYASFSRVSRVGVSHVKKRMSLVKGQRSPRGSVTPMKGRVTRSGGECEQAVRDQLEPYLEDHPVRVQMALTCARILDNPDRVALHPTTVRQLNETIEKITATTKKKSRGRLSVVQAMTARR